MPRSAANVVLCVLTLVGSTSLTVRHAHARGGVPHAHGLSAAAVLAPSDTGGDGRHEHLLLCGVELYHHDEPAGNAPADPGPAAAQVTVGFGDACDQRGDTVAEPAGDELLAGYVQTVDGNRGVFCSRLILTFEPPVCDSARGARTGVLLV